LLPLAIFSARPVVAGVVGGAIFSFTLYGMALVYTLYFQEALNYKPIRAGLAFAPLTLTAVLASALITGRYIGKFGPKSGLVSGMSLSALALGILAAAPRPTDFFIIAVSFVIFGIGMVISGPSQIITVMAFISDEYRNLGSSVLNSVRQCGGMFGVAILGAIVSNNLIADTPFAMIVACGACLLGIVVALCFIPRLAHFHARTGMAHN
jgi:DHA2 family methylenomycin A resistance protein-like MFS transporter